MDSIEAALRIKQQDNEDLNKVFEKVTGETESLKANMYEIIVELQGETQFQRFLDYFLDMITRKCNKISDVIGEKQQLGTLNALPGSSILLNYYSTMYYDLKGLIEYFSETYPQYFNMDKCIPKAQKTASQLEFLSAVRSTNHNSHCELRGIALMPIRNFIKSPKACSYREFYYFQGLSKCIISCCGPCKDVCIGCELRDSLVYHNFNSNLFYNHQTENYRNKYLMEKKPQKQLEALRDEYRKVNQLTANNSIAYRYGVAPIKEQLLGFFREEEKYLQSKEEEQTKKNTVTTTKNNTDRDYKMKFSLSVPALSSWFRLQVNTDILPCGTKKETNDLINFLIQNVSTLHTDEISADSFRNKFNTIDPKTLDTLHDYVMAMLNEINKLRAS